MDKVLFKFCGFEVVRVREFENGCDVCISYVYIKLMNKRKVLRECIYVYRDDSRRKFGNYQLAPHGVHSTQSRRNL